MSQETTGPEAQAVFDAMEDGLLVFDALGNVVVVNDAEARLAGFQSAGAMGRHLDWYHRMFDVFELDGALVPVDRWPVARVLAGETLSGLQLRVRRTDTGRTWTIRFSARPVRDASGRVIRGVVISRNVTEETTREQAVRRSEARFQALADTIPQLVWTARADGTVDHYNEWHRKYQGLLRQPDGTWHWGTLVHPDDFERTEAVWRASLETGKDYEVEHRIRMADGTWRWHVSRARCVRGEDGEHSWYGTAADIHANKLAQDALHHAIATRDQVVSVVSHDLRQPLGVLRGSAELLRRTLPNGPERQRHEVVLARMDRQIDGMAKLIDELLDAARLQAGVGIDLRRAPCDLVALARQVVDEQRRETGRDLDLQAPDAVWGEWDPDRLERVVANLVSNAIKYSATDKPIRVVVETPDSKARLCVIDHGIGIPEHELGVIFDWFKRGENARGATGAGVGLAGARRIAELHGGRLSVHSEIGQGSTFTLELPMRGGA